MYKKFRLAAVLILMAITIFFYVPVVWGDLGKPNASGYISDAILATPTPPPSPNAFGYAYYNSTALQARIETADPVIGNGYWSWSIVRIAAQGPGGATVECGWIKYGYGNIYGFTQSKVAGHTPTVKTWGQQYPGQTHPYLIKRKGAGTGRWKYYIDGSQVDTRYAGFDVAYVVGSGGEVESIHNDMGVSGCLDNQFRDLNKVWHYYMYTDEIEDYPYHIVPLPVGPSWQVWGFGLPH